MTISGVAPCASKRASSFLQGKRLASRWTETNNPAAKVMVERIHVLPVNDLRPHIENGAWCHCQPRIAGEIVIHNAYDGREFYEKEREKESMPIPAYPV